MDRAQFEQHIREHWSAIIGIARRFDGGADLADLCQDVVVVAWRRREQLREPEGFGPWVRQIALNVGRSHSRRREGRMGPLLESHATAPDPAQGVVDQCTVEQALATLSQRERLTVEAHHVLGWSLTDISVAFEEPVGTTKSRLSRARAKLRGELRGYGWTRLGRAEKEEGT